MQSQDVYSQKFITREEINKAIKEYLQKGGTIKVYPPQVVEIPHLISVPYVAYEELGTELFGS